MATTPSLRPLEFAWSVRAVTLSSAAVLLPIAKLTPFENGSNNFLSDFGTRRPAQRRRARLLAEGRRGRTDRQ